MLKKITQDELIPTLEEAGIKAKEYANPSSIGTPIEFFISTVPGGRGILIKKGEKIGLKIATDKEHRQAVLQVNEPKRAISRTVQFTRRVHEDQKLTESDLIPLAKSKWNIEIPGSTISVSNIKEVKRVPMPYHEVVIHYTAVITAKVEKTSSNKFLLGMDETSHFIAILPKKAKVKSVKEAHAYLKPHGVHAGAKRQGEFFFVKATKEEVTGIDETKIRNSVPLEKNSNHHAQFAIPKGHVPVGMYQSKNDRYNGVKFVKGLIFDQRGYRHAPVDLGDVWHKVYRNKEINTTLSPSRRTRRYD